MATPVQIVIDCADPPRLAEFWATALSYVVQPPPPGYDSWPAFLAEMGVPESQWSSKSAVIDPDGVGPRVFFQQVPEPKTVKNRIHLDLNVGGGPSAAVDERRERVRAEAQRLTGAGAEIVREVEELGEVWVTMRDPEGNEFDVQ